MKYSLLLSLSTLLFILNATSQNLVENHSFEDQRFAPCGIASQFEAILPGWDSPSRLGGSVYSTSIDQDCYNFQPNSSYSGPVGMKGTESPSDGDAFAGIWIYTIEGQEIRQYMRGQLSKPLIEGKSYKVKLKVSLADFMESSVGELGIAFMKDTEIQRDGDLIIAEPQLRITTNLNITNGWAKFDETFVSDGDHNYFIIGNFKSDIETDIFQNPSASGANSTYGAYYYFDEVSVEEVTVNSTSSQPLESLSVYPTLVTSQLTYELKGSTFKEFKIVNTFGRTIKKVNTNGQMHGQIECSSLAPGSYFLIGENQDGKRVSTKFFRAD
ncbi:MAG: hypothetical protein AB8F78_09335 [Saprospiraceae bacterium]